MTKLYWLSHCGNHAIKHTSCMVEVEHFTTIEARDKRLAKIVRLHERDSDEVESYQYGEVSAPVIPIGHLAIVLDGGMVQSVLSDGGLAGHAVTIIDYDCEGDYGTPIPQDGGGFAEANVARQKVEASAVFLPRALKAIADHNSELGYGEG